MVTGNFTQAALSGFVAAFRQGLQDAALPAARDVLADRERVDALAALEELKNTAAAVQARLAVDLDTSVRSQHTAAGVPLAQRGRGVAEQIALARRESPHRGRQLLGLAKDLHRDLPHTLAAVRGGLLSEYRACLIAQETGCLDSVDRAVVDAELFAHNSDDDAPQPAALEWGTRQLASAARAIGYRLDPAAATRRAAHANRERRVSLRPAPDTMTYLSALLPVAHGVAAYAALTRGAQCARAAGDERGKGQLMADLLVASITDSENPPGAASRSGSAALSPVPAVPVTVDLVISDRSLLAGGHDPALLLGPGVGATPIPAQTARELLADALQAHPDSLAWLRKLYANPEGDLIAMSSRRRFAPNRLADFLRIRDQGICRTPWCDAPITEDDHIRPAAHGGRTAAHEMQGYCAACNHAKQAAGWHQTITTAPRHQVHTHTPTGRHYHSTTRPPPGQPLAV